MTVVSSLEVEIGSDIAGLTSGLGTAKKQVDGFVTSIGRGMVGLGKTMAVGVTLPLLAFGAIATDQAMKFEAAMTNTASVLSITGTELDSLSDKVLAIGSTAQAGPQAVADAFYDIVSGVQDSSTHMAILDAAIATSEAGAANLQATTSGLIAVMNAYNLSAADATDISDVFTRTVGLGVGSMDEFVSALSPIAGIAAGVGISFEDIGVQAAFMTTKGFTASQAATRLQAAITAIIKPNADMAAALNAMGVESGTAALQQWGLAGTLGRLETVLGGSTDAMAGALGTTEALGAAMILNQPGLEAFWETYVDGLDGATASARKIQMTSAAAKFDLLKSAVSGLTIAIGAALLPVLGSISDFVRPIITDVENWMIANPELASTLVAVGGALAIAGPLLVGIGTAITFAAPAVALLGGALALLASPIVLVAAGLAGLAYVASQFIDFTALASNIKDGISGVLAGLTITLPDFSAIGTGITDSLSNMTIDTSGIEAAFNTHFDDILNVITTVAGLVLGGPIGLAIGGAKLVSSAIENDFLGIGAFLNSSGITAAVEGAFNDVKTTIDGLISSVFGGGQATEIDLGATAFALKNADAGGTSGPLALFVSDLQRGFAALEKIATNIWANIGPGFTDLADGVKGFVENLGGTETEGLLRVLTVIGGAIGGIVAKVVELGSDVFGAVLSSIGDALPSIGSAINDFISAISNLGEGDVSGFVSNLFDSFANLGESVLNFMGIDIQIPSFDEALAGWQTFGDSLGTIIRFAGDQIGAVFNNIAVGVRSFIRDIGETVDRAKLAFADIALALNSGDTVAQVNWTAATLGIQGSETAKNLEQQIRDSLLAGDLNIDVSQFVTSDPAAIAAKVVDPLLIQGAIDTALAEGDAGALGVLLPIASELGIETQGIVDQFAATLTEATAEAYPATVVADVLVTAGGIDVTGFVASIQAAANAAADGVGLPNIPGGLQPAQAIPHLASGGDIVTDGAAYMHAGETVLNKEESRAYRNERGGNNVGQIIINGVQDIDGMLAELSRRGYMIPRTT